MVSRKEVNNVVSDNVARAIGVGAVMYATSVTVTPALAGITRVAGTKAGTAANFGANLGMEHMSNLHQNVGHILANGIGGATTTQHYKDGSYSVEGDGYSIDYDRNGKKKRVNTGHYMND